MAAITQPQTVLRENSAGVAAGRRRAGNLRCPDSQSAGARIHVGRVIRQSAEDQPGVPAAHLRRVLNGHPLAGIAMGQFRTGDRVDGLPFGQR